MRIQYTLPGLMPTPSPVEAPEQFPGTFKATMRRVRSTSRSNWRRLLRLDRHGSVGISVGPPPRPVGLEMRDAAYERTRWRGMLEQKTAAFEQGPGTEAIEQMLQLLLTYQQQEDSISARSLVEARG